MRCSASLVAPQYQTFDHKRFRLPMSYHTLFGAYIQPVNNSNSLSDVSQTVTEFHGSSRNGSFQNACKILLDVATGHELLRLVSGESMTQETDDPTGRTAFTLITADVAPDYIGQFDSLLHYCATRSAELATLWNEQLGGYSADEVATAQQLASVYSDLNSGSSHGEDGDSPHFVFAALVTLRAAIAKVCIADTALVYFNWQPS